MLSVIELLESRTGLKKQHDKENLDTDTRYEFIVIISANVYEIVDIVYKHINRYRSI